jgi:hypothetical protein
MFRIYAAVAPKPEPVSVSLDKMGDPMRQDYDWSREVAAIKAPTARSVRGLTGD